MNALTKPLPRVPAALQPYVEVLGTDLAIEFFLRFGGAYMHLPRNGTLVAKSEPALLIGQANMAKLGDRLCDIGTRVPLANHWLAAVMDHRGHSVASIARCLRLSDVTVRRWKAAGWPL